MTEQWAVEHTDNIVAFLAGHGIPVDDEVKGLLAEHLDDEIEGYCDNCDQNNKCEDCERPSGPQEI